MEKKMRGIVDPYTLGLLIALISPLVISNVNTDKDQSIQGVKQESHETQQLAWIEDSGD